MEKSSAFNLRKLIKMILRMLRNNGLNEKEIVFVAQINSAYAYWTRILNALGVEIGDEPLGIPIELINDHD